MSVRRIPAAFLFRFACALREDQSYEGIFVAACAAAFRFASGSSPPRFRSGSSCPDFLFAALALPLWLLCSRTAASALLLLQPLALPSFVLSLLDQALDLLVSASFHIAVFTPLTYQPCRLQGVLPAYAVGIFFSRGASRLDAFSVYPVRTSLPCYAVGTTTVAPVVRPFRSSRTRNSSSHDSYAHDG